MSERKPPPRGLILGAPSVFGHQVDVSWKQPGTLDELVLLRHAEIQHEFAFRVRTRLRKRGVGQRQFVGATAGHAADDNWFPLDHFGRGLNGTSWFTFDQMLRIEQHTGPILVRLRFPRTVLTNPALIGSVPYADSVDPEVYREVHGRPHPQAESNSEPGPSAVPQSRA
ncbi:hypothetical protein [Nocardioides alpinus]|uniref:Uncharacterized protein n=1 Tax=Nocardioides alpinus TaxID=748909 RepID=A0ABX4QT84_9ACTN|nr:hypothetical protein [Nocardioides alpinus]PKH37863.1 hypothetical protein CXG46_20975 [Nocardioides alpinus]